MMKLRCQLNLLPFKTQICKCFMLTHVTLYRNAFHTISSISVVWRTQATFCIKTASSGPQNVRDPFFPKGKQSIIIVFQLEKGANLSTEYVSASSRIKSWSFNWTYIDISIFQLSGLSIIRTIQPSLHESGQSRFDCIVALVIFFWPFMPKRKWSPSFWQQIISFFVFRCHTISGKCFCKSGFTGLLCDQQISEILT